MSIGFYDFDIYLKPTKLMLNLEAMKVASYFKNKGVAIYLINDLKDIDYYDQVFVFRNVMPKSSAKNKKNILTFNSNDVEYYGLAYQGGIYLPMEEKYEKQIALPDLYWPYFRDKINSGKLSLSQLEKIIDSHFLRLKSGNILIDPSMLQKKNKLFLYDYEIEKIPQWEERLQVLPEIMKEKKINVVNRMKITTPENLDKITKIPGFKSDDIEFFYNCSYKEFKEIYEKHENWISSRDGIRYYFGDVKNPNNINEVMSDFLLSINKYFLAKSMNRACTFIVSDKSEVSSINRLQKAFQYWTDVRVGNETLKQYFKKRMSRDFDSLYNIVLKTPYGKKFDELCSLTKNDIRSKGWYYRG